MEENKNFEATKEENQNGENQVPQQPKKENRIIRFAKRNVKTAIAFALGVTAKAIWDYMMSGNGSATTGVETPVTTQVLPDGTEITNF